MRVIIIAALLATFSNASKSKPPLLYFDMSGLSNRIVMIRRVADLAPSIKVLKTTDSVPVIDQYAMAAVVRKLYMLVNQHAVIFVHWRPLDGCVDVEFNPRATEEGKGRILLIPGVYSHFMSPRARLQIMHLSEKLQNSSPRKILRAFSQVDID